MRTSYFDFFVEEIWHRLKDHRYECVSSVIIGFLCYGFYYTNMVYNHDCMYNIVIPLGYSGLGRWGTDIMTLIFSHPTMPWFDGLLSLLLFTIGICLICNIFELKSKCLKIILAGIVIGFPSIANDYLYMYQAIHYSLAFVLAIIPVYFLKNKTGWIGVFVSVSCIIFLLSLYQGTLAVTSSLIVVYLVKAFLYNNYKEIDIVKKGIYALIVLALGVFFYILITKAIFCVMGIDFRADALNRMDAEISFLDRFNLTYVNFFSDLFRRGHKLGFSKMDSILHLLILCSSLFFLVTKMRVLNATRIIFTSLLILIYPLSVNFMYLAVDPDAIHVLVLIGYISIYVLVAIIMDNSMSRYFNDLARIAMCIILFLHMRTANVVAMRTLYLYENAFSFYTSLVTQIKSSNLLNEKSRLAICGHTDNFLYDFKDYPPEFGLMGGGVNNYSKQRFIKFYCGFDIPGVSLEEKKEIIKTEEFRNMPIYPSQGSIKKIGDVIVVKMSKDVNDSH